MAQTLWQVRLVDRDLLGEPCVWMMMILGEESEAWEMGHKAASEVAGRRDQMHKGVVPLVLPYQLGSWMRMNRIEWHVMPGSST